jgi:dTDP-4-dehydrorhamnose 3,5-epimerase
MSLVIETQALAGLLVVQSTRFRDRRGYFMEHWSRDQFKRLGIRTEFIQENQSLSRRVHTLRGLHFQRAPFEQAKLVRVLTGRVFDVSVDLRRESATFGQWCGVTLKAEDGRQLFIPKGFAHGFLSLEPNTTVAYKVDAPYCPALEGGIRWNDDHVGIPWPIGKGKPLLSERDRNLPTLSRCLIS